MSDVEEKKQKKPLTWLLILINSGILFLISIWSAKWPLGYISAFFITGWLIAFSSIWHGLIAVIERRISFPPIVRSLFFLFPVIVVLVLSAYSSHLPQPINQQFPAISPSKKYQASFTSPDDYWHLKITGTDIQSFEKTTTYIGHFSIYWLWDNDDRLWVYNSDVQFLYFWHFVDGNWVEAEYGLEGEKNPSFDFSPPEDVYPYYAKERLLKK